MTPRHTSCMIPLRRTLRQNFHTSIPTFWWSWGLLLLRWSRQIPTYPRTSPWECWKGQSHEEKVQDWQRWEREEQETGQVATRPTKKLTSHGADNSKAPDKSKAKYKSRDKNVKEKPWDGQQPKKQTWRVHDTLCKSSISLEATSNSSGGQRGQPKILSYIESYRIPKVLDLLKSYHVMNHAPVRMNQSCYPAVNHSRLSTSVP